MLQSVVVKDKGVGDTEIVLVSSWGESNADRTRGGLSQAHAIGGGSSFSATVRLVRVKESASLVSLSRCVRVTVAEPMPESLEEAKAVTDIWRIVYIIVNGIKSNSTCSGSPSLGRWCYWYDHHSV